MNKDKSINIQTQRINIQVVRIVGLLCLYLFHAWNKF